MVMVFELINVIFFVWLVLGVLLENLSLDWISWFICLRLELYFRLYNIFYCFFWLFKWVCVFFVLLCKVRFFLVFEYFFWKLIYVSYLVFFELWVCVEELLMRNIFVSVGSKFLKKNLVCDKIFFKIMFCNINVLNLFCYKLVKFGYCNVLCFFISGCYMFCFCCYFCGWKKLVFFCLVVFVCCVIFMLCVVLIFWV